MYEYGWGTSADPAQARHWYEASAKAGNASAAASLTRLEKRTTAATEHSLAEAAGTDSIADIRRLLDQGADPNKADKFGRTPLTEAITHGKTDVVKLLLAKGTKPDLTNGSGDTPLTLATEAGNGQVVRALLKARAKVNQTNRAGATPLIIAATGDHPEIVSLLLASGASVSARDPLGRTALDIAVQKKQPQMIAALKKAGATEATDARRSSERADLASIAESNPAFFKGWTPLMIAAWRDRPDLVRSLMTSADLTTRNPAGQTALSIAAAQGHADVAKLLLASAKDEACNRDPACHPLLAAVSAGDAKMIDLLVPAYRNTPSFPSVLNAALADSISKQRWPVTLELLKSGAKLHTAKGTVSPLVSAAPAAPSDLIAALIDRGLDINATDSSGRTALILAAQNGRAQTVSLLIAHHANLNHQDSLHHSALMKAARYGHADIVKQLIGAGANLALTTETGNTALMLASEAGTTASVNELLHVESAVDAKNNVGDTALILAARKGHQDAVAALLKAGANPRLKNNRRQEALDVVPAGKPALAKMISDAKASRSWISEILR
jgi:ankyrin repeat protein